MDTITPHPVSSDQHRWLTRELQDWLDEGIIDSSAAEAIAARYVATGDHGRRRFSLGRLLLSLGAAFVGVGIIWLVAANLDQLPPLLRFAVVAAIWLALLASGELLTLTRPVRGAVRLMAALAFGAVVFQAAQSMQVPAYSPHLVGIWAAGALVHAYAARATTPLVVGVITGLVWWVWQPLWNAGSVAAAVVSFGTAAVVVVSLAVVHDRGLVDFGQVWRSAGALLGMVTLFMAAVPYTTTEGFEWDGWLVGSLVLAVLAVGAAVALSRGRARLEPLAAVAVLGVAVLMTVWDTGTDTSSVDAADVAHAAVGVVAFVGLAVALVAVGTLRDNPALTLVALVGLVVFTTFQAFAVFAPIVQGAWLFLTLGVVFLATGFLFDRARRGIAASLEATPPDQPRSTGPEGAER